MPVEKLKRFLDENGVRYVTINHSPAYTAQEIAARAHISGHEFAKTVMVKLDGELAMAVLRASDRVDLDLLRSAAQADDIELATEADFGSRFPQVEVGAMPPFGNLYAMDVYVEEALARDPRIGFNAGSHTEIIALDYADFERLVKPRVANFTSQAAAA